MAILDSGKFESCKQNFIINKKIQKKKIKHIYRILIFLALCRYINSFLLVGWINVEWDNGIALPYRFGNNGFITAYDIEPCDEPRILESQPIAVGCLVRRGIIMHNFIYKTAKTFLFRNTKISKLRHCFRS